MSYSPRWQSSKVTYQSRDHKDNSQTRHRICDPCLSRHCSRLRQQEENANQDNYQAESKPMHLVSLVIRRHCYCQVRDCTTLDTEFRVLSKWCPTFAAELGVRCHRQSARRVSLVTGKEFRFVRGLIIQFIKIESICERFSHAPAGHLKM
jgi:hypothetical protein